MSWIMILSAALPYVIIPQICKKLDGMREYLLIDSVSLYCNWQSQGDG